MPPLAAGVRRRPSPPAGWGRRTTRSTTPGRAAPRAARRARGPGGCGRPSRPSRSTSPPCDASAPPTHGAHSARSASGDLKVFSAVRFCWKKRFTAPGMCPATGSSVSFCAAEAVGGSGIDEHVPGLLHVRQHLADRDRGDGIDPRREAGRLPVLHVVRERQPDARPRRQPAVEHRHLRVAEPAQHPPHARREGAGVGVVDHHLRVVADAQAAEGGGGRVPGRAADGGRWCRVFGPDRSVSRFT